MCILFFLHVINVLIKLQHKASLYLNYTSVLRLLHSLPSPPVKRSSHTAENHQAKGNPWRGIETEGKKKRIYSVLCAADQKHGSHMIKGI